MLERLDNQLTDIKMERSASRGVYALDPFYDMYELQKDIPVVKKGAIFYHDRYDSNKGSIGAGCLKLAWTNKGGCYSLLCGDTIVFHVNAIKDEGWFKLVQKPKQALALLLIDPNPTVRSIAKEVIDQEIFK